MFDDVFADPAAIVEAAARHAVFAAPAPGSSGYPGPQAPAPGAYAAALVAAIDPAFAALFGTAAGSVGEIQCQLSLVTVPPAALHPQQTVPHVDLAQPDRFAVLHYLCDRPFGGTAFYRQDATGLELVTRAEWERFVAARDATLAEGRVPAYPSEATPGFTRIGSVPARFNRVVAYRSNLLHSGEIPDGPDYSDDPRRGRLTGNLFARYRAAAPDAAM